MNRDTRSIQINEAFESRSALAIRMNRGLHHNLFLQFNFLIINDLGSDSRSSLCSYVRN